MKAKKTKLKKYKVEIKHVTTHEFLIYATSAKAALKPHEFYFDPHNGIPHRSHTINHGITHITEVTGVL